MSNSLDPDQARSKSKLNVLLYFNCLRLDIGVPRLFLMASLSDLDYEAVYEEGTPCRGFWLNIFSDSQYPKLLNATC